MTLSRKIKISAPARIHIALISMGDNPYRKYGGIGFAINGFDTVIEAQCSNNRMCSVRDARSAITSFDEIKLISIQALLDNIAESEHLKKIDILVASSPPINSGFGSGTALELACIESLFLCNQYEISEERIVKLSSRGATSGVGVKTYFQGGFVFDLGVPAGGDFLPSSASTQNSPKALHSKGWKFPEWSIAIFLPKSRSIIPSGAYEIDFFEKYAPIKIEDVYQTSFLTTFGILPSILDENKLLFSEAVSELQRLGWKSLEWAQYDGVLNRCRATLVENGLSGVGLSSMGPAIYCLSENLDKKNTLPEGFHCDQVMPNNTGRLVDIC